MRHVLSGLRAKLLAGVVVTVPTVATFLALRFLFENVDAFLGPWIAELIGRRIPGLGLLATLVFVLVVGVVATNYAGRRAISLVERLFTRVPLVRRIYGASKQIVESAALSKRGAFREVVMIEYPRRGLFSYGFVTSYTVRHGSAGPLRLANVFVPGPPVPTTGVLVAVPVQELFYLDVPIDEALKLILSGGLTAPPELRSRDAPTEPASPAPRE